MRSKAKRVSITIPQQLFVDFEETSRMVGYKKRSKAVGDAIRRFVSDHKLLKQVESGSCAGTVTFTYKPHIKGLTDALMTIQHEHSNIINATLHIHLDEETCLETLAVKGSIDVIRKLIQKLETLKTENVQYVLLPRT